MKTLQELIDEGINIKATCSRTDIITLVSGDVYAAWLAYCERFLRQKYPDDPQTLEFADIARHANGNEVARLDRLIGILKAFSDIPAAPSSDNIDTILEKICTNFHRCARAILNHHAELCNSFSLQLLSC